MPRANLRPLAGFTPLNATATSLVVCEVASGYATAIYPGDPLIMVTDGTVARTPAGTNQLASIDGISYICVDIIQYKDSAGYVRMNATNVPASTTWTAPQESTRVLAIPAVDGKHFKIRGLTAAASLVAARALRGKNCEHSYATLDPGLGLSGAQLVIAGAATTALQWRIVEIATMASNDPLLVNFEAVVVVNKPFGWPVVGASTTGV